MPRAERSRLCSPRLRPPSLAPCSGERVPEIDYPERLRAVVPGPELAFARDRAGPGVTRALAGARGEAEGGKGE